VSIPPERFVLPVSPPSTDSAIVDGLIAAVVAHGFSVSALPVDDALEALSLREVVVLLSGQEFRCLLDNEYGDVDPNNLPLVLNMVLMGLEDYDALGDYLAWAKDYGLSAGLPWVDALWARLQGNAVAMRALVPPLPAPISSWDWSMAAGDALILRGLP
jgi:hypothetical protein